MNHDQTQKYDNLLTEYRRHIEKPENILLQDDQKTSHLHQLNWKGVVNDIISIDDWRKLIKDIDTQTSEIDKILLSKRPPAPSAPPSAPPTASDTDTPIFLMLAAILNKESDTLTSADQSKK